MHGQIHDMSGNDVRTILAVQALEQSDADDAILTDADRRESAAMAGAPLAKDADTREQDRFLAARAELLQIRTTTRHPEGSEWMHPSPSRFRFGWLGLGLVGAAAVVGFLTNELGPERRINVLSFPLLGILLWNLMVYLHELVGAFRPRAKAPHPTEGWMDAMVRFLQPVDAVSRQTQVDEKPDPVLRSAEKLFAKRWRELTAPIFHAKLKALLHLVALVLALSAILGMYARGLAREYEAVWESTFFRDGETLRPVLSAVLGPAAALKGEKFPSAAELDRIRWSAEGSEEIGENAARWIHWYAITVGVFVLFPRAVLAFLWKWRARRRTLRLDFRTVGGTYFEHLLATSSGMAQEVVVVPYAFDLKEEQKKRVLQFLEDHLERRVEVHWTRAVPFGEEETLPHLPGVSESEVIPLFDFAATPEEETHLALLRTLLNDGPNPVHSLLLDATGFDTKSLDFPDAEKRHHDRIEAWRHLLVGTGIEILVISGAVPHAT